MDAKPSRVAIVGAGFVGCEVAATARKAGLDVTLIDVAPRPLLPLGPELGERAAALHRAHGVDLRLDTPVAGVDARGVDTRERRARGRRGCVGGSWAQIPNTEWLDSSGLALDARGGIVCDGTLTSVADDDILAASAMLSPAAPAGLRVTACASSIGRSPPSTARWPDAMPSPTPTSAARTSRAPVLLVRPVRRQDPGLVGFPARAAALTIVDEDGPRLIAEARDAAGRLVGAIAFNNAKKLAAYRRELAAEASPA